MVAAVMLGVFIATYALGSNAGMFVVLVASCFVPDELPFVDEVIQIALLVKRFSKPKSPKNVEDKTIDENSSSTDGMMIFRREQDVKKSDKTRW